MKGIVLWLVLSLSAFVGIQVGKQLQQTRMAGKYLPANYLRDVKVYQQKIDGKPYTIDFLCQCSGTWHLLAHNTEIRQQLIAASVLDKPVTLSGFKGFHDSGSYFLVSGVEDYKP